MDTTISDLAQFIAALMRNEGLSMAARAEMVRPRYPSVRPTSFPTSRLISRRPNSGQTSRPDLE